MYTFYMRKCTCKTCNKIYFIFPSQKGGTYCSKDCYRKKQKVYKLPATCKVCGKVFMTSKSRLAIGRGKYCSPKCYWVSLLVPLEQTRKREANQRNKWRFGGNREKALLRDNHQCKICKTKNDLIIHHIDGTGYKSVRDFKKINNAIENLLTLCRSCHTKLHNQDIVWSA